METTKSLSHETAKIPQLSIETNERFINLLNDYFGDNKAFATDYEKGYWSLLQSAMIDDNIAPEERHGFVQDTKQNIESIHVLYAIFNELRTK